MIRRASLLLAGAMSIAHAAHAERLPAPGGEVVVALDARDREAFLEAHRGVPLLEPAATDPRERLARPGLEDIGLRSRVLRALSLSADAALLTVAPGVPPAEVGAGVRACLTGEAWAARVLRAAGVSVEVEVRGREIALEASRPVGPLLELLESCWVRADAVGGPFRAEAGGELLVASGEGPGGAPMLDAVRIAAPDAPADVRPAGSARAGAGGDELQAPTPDVVLLLAPPETRAADPFGLASDEGLGGFAELLSPELIAAVYWGGRGARTDGVLPPGVAPSRPLPRVTTAPEAAPPRMQTLAPDAPTLRLDGEPGVLTGPTRERLSAMLRARGWGTSPSATAGVTVLRWRPLTSEPALALLQLAADHPESLEPSATVAPLLDRLLAPDPAERLAAAVELEARWLEERRVVPLFTAERWVTVSGAVRGVRVRDDGIPLLHDAYLAGSR